MMTCMGNCNKTRLGNLVDFKGGAKKFFEMADNLPIHVLPIKPSYIEIVKILPFIHRDPFDRMIIGRWAKRVEQH